MSIPTRHSEKAVDRYRSYIELVTLNYPNPIVVDPSPLSTDTFACRFRDAVAGIMRFGSSPELLESVSQWAGDYVVANVKGSGQLAIGKTSVVKEAMNPANASVGRVIDASLAPIEVKESPSELVLDAILVLLEYSILEHATLNGVDEKHLQEKLNKLKRPIELINQNGTITLL